MKQLLNVYILSLCLLKLYVMICIWLQQKIKELKKQQCHNADEISNEKKQKKPRLCKFMTNSLTDKIYD